MWLAAPYIPPFEWAVHPKSALVLILAIAGLFFDFLGLVAFRKMKTTINPLKPEKTSFIVTIGVYAITRNPMYLGMALLLTAWAIHLSTAMSLLGPIFFVLFITRFQILPEEKILKKAFGTPYENYLKKVRRWI